MRVENKEMKEKAVRLFLLIIHPLLSFFHQLHLSININHVSIWLPLPPLFLLDPRSRGSHQRGRAAGAFPQAS